MEHDSKSTKCDVIYGAPAALTWEEIDINGQINLERHVISRKVTAKRRKEEVEQKVERLTGENAHSKSRKRQESINESEMTMAERLGDYVINNFFWYFSASTFPL